MTHPGVPVSPGFPGLEGPAQQAIRMAQDRLGVLTRARFPLPVKTLTEDEKAEALKSAKEEACQFCAAFHAGASTAACPRLATFELNGDNAVVKGSYWPEGVTDSAIEMNGAGEVITVTFHEHVGWNTGRVVFVDDVADDGAGEDEAASGLHPARFPVPCRGPHRGGVRPPRRPLLRADGHHARVQPAAVPGEVQALREGARGHPARAVRVPGLAVSPPTPEQEAERADSALAALTGTITERTPVTDLDRDMMRLRMVAEAKDRDIPWAAIGAALGCSGKEAHRRMKQLAARTQRNLLLEQARQDGITGKGRVAP